MLFQRAIQNSERQGTDFMGMTWQNSRKKQKLFFFLLLHPGSFLKRIAFYICVQACNEFSNLEESSSARNPKISKLGRELWVSLSLWDNSAWKNGKECEPKVKGVAKETWSLIQLCLQCPVRPWAELFLCVSPSVRMRAWRENGLPSGPSVLQIWKLLLSVPLFKFCCRSQASELDIQNTILLLKEYMLDLENSTRPRVDH